MRTGPAGLSASGGGTLLVWCARTGPYLIAVITYPSCSHVRTRLEPCHGSLAIYTPALQTPLGVQRCSDSSSPRQLCRPGEHRRRGRWYHFCMSAGNDLNEDITPVEAGLTWTIAKNRREKCSFLGGEVRCWHPCLCGTLSATSGIPFECAWRLHSVSLSKLASRCLGLVGRNEQPISTGALAGDQEAAGRRREDEAGRLHLEGRPGARAQRGPDAGGRDGEDLSPSGCSRKCRSLRSSGAADCIPVLAEIPVMTPEMLRCRRANVSRRGRTGLGRGCEQ